VIIGRLGRPMTYQAARDADLAAPTVNTGDLNAVGWGIS
jgi:hypothetical protein